MSLSVTLADDNYDVDSTILTSNLALREITISEAINNLAKNSTSPEYQENVVLELNKLERKARSLTKDQWNNQKQISLQKGTLKKKPQFARYIESATSEYTFACTINYYTTPIHNPEIFYKIFNFSEEFSRRLGIDANPLGKIDPTNIIIAKILAEVYYQTKAREISKECKGNPDFLVPTILEFGSINGMDPKNKQYYIKMEYINSEIAIPLTKIMKVPNTTICTPTIEKLKLVETYLIKHNIWHNDLITTDNILVYLTEDGNIGLYIIDFGEASSKLSNLK